MNEINIMKINDVVVPAPVRSLGFNYVPQFKKITTASGKVVAQKISDRIKLEFQNIEWRYLSNNEWRVILSELVKGIGTITVYNSQEHKFLKISVLFENISEVPYIYNKNNEIEKYSSCRCTISDLMQEITEVENIV